MSDENKNQWVEIEEQVVIPDSVRRSTELLTKLKGTLEQSLEQEQKKLKALKEQLLRLKKRGGGQ